MDIFTIFLRWWRHGRMTAPCRHDMVASSVRVISGYAFTHGVMFFFINCVFA